MRSLCLALLCLGSTALFAPAQCPCQPCRPQACQAQDCDCFEEAYDQAVRDNKPLLIFVQQKARGIEGCLSCSVACYPGQRGAGVIIGLPDGKGNLLEVARRDSYPTEAWLQRRVAELQRQHTNLACYRQGFFLRIGLGIVSGRPGHPSHHPRGPCR